jgi:biotin carboxylase
VAWICLIGNSEWGAKAVRECGLDVGVLADRQGTLSKELLGVSSAVVPVRLTDGEELRQGLDALSGILGEPRAVVSFTELGLVPAAELSAERGLPTNDLKTLERTRDKALMREALGGDPNLGLPYFAGTAGEVANELAGRTERGGPWIVKPVDGFGSQSVGVVGSPREAEEWRRHHEEDPGRRWICEPLVEGPEFSVEAVSFGGRHRVLGITQKETTGPPHFVEVGHAFPADVDHETRSAIEAAAERTLTLLGVEMGATHTEVRLDPRGVPVTIETHTRPGGDHIPELVQQACGLNQYTLAVQSLLAADNISRPEHPIEYHRAAAIRFLRAEEGTLRSIGYKNVPESEHVIRHHIDFELGEWVPPLRSSFARVGYVMCRGDDARQAGERAAAVAEAFEFVVDR